MTVAVAVAVAGMLWLGHTSMFTTPRTGPTVLAHRGLGQTFDLDGVTGDTCTAQRIHAPEHPYLENTIPSMRAAFDAGADVVELDVHRTSDEQFAVFHDWTVDCRTEGHGETRRHTLAELKRLDVGYGYTADGGRTFPFRGKGVGLLPSLDEVLDAFPDRELLIHVKSDDRVDGERLADRLARLPAARQATLTVYGGNVPVAAVARRLPGMRVTSRETMTNCLARYVAAGAVGYVPDACRHTQLHIPEKIGPWLWGWPHRFVARMAEHDTRVVVVGGTGGWSEGFDSTRDLSRVPDGFAGMVWTNRVDRVAGPLRARRG